MKDINTQISRIKYFNFCIPKRLLNSSIES